MKVPDKEFFEKNKVHLEMLTIKGEWKRLDTFYAVSYTHLTLPTIDRV